ncbi:putative isomerase YddE [subsurface metagenome]
MVFYPIASAIIRLNQQITERGEVVLIKERTNMSWLNARRISTFTNDPYAGNPAWVVISIDEPQDEKRLQILASELNPVSDTVFVFPGTESSDIHLRFFSQSEEINFSGHGTIAAYHALEPEGLINFTEPITLVRQKTKTGIQHIELRVKDKKIERVTVSLPMPQFISMPLEVKSIATFLGISPIDILDAAHPIGVVALSGCSNIIVPVKSCNFLLNIEPNFRLMKDYCDRFHLTEVVVYCLDTMDKDNTAHIRHFAPAIGINEDPVSGVGSASLGCYLVQNRIVSIEEMTRMVMEQGCFMKRPGIVYTHVYTYKNQILKVSFGGQGVVTFEGQVLLPKG